MELPWKTLESFLKGKLFANSLSLREEN